MSTRYELRYELNQAALAAEVVNDGVFPLITNDRGLSEQALLLAYKVGSSRVDLQACKLEYSIVSPK